MPVPLPLRVVLEIKGDLSQNVAVHVSKQRDTFIANRHAHRVGLVARKHGILRNADNRNGDGKLVFVNLVKRGLQPEYARKCQEEHEQH